MRVLAAPVTVGMERQDVADICSVPVEDVLGYGNGYVQLRFDAVPADPSTIDSPKEGIEEEEPEADDEAEAEDE